MIKKILKLLKKLWVIFLVVLCLSRLATCFLSCRRSESGIKTANSKIFYASADEVATVAAEPDLTNVNTGWNAADYPTANLISYPYYQGKTFTNAGITYTVNSDGSITMNGTSTAYSLYRFMVENNGVFVDGKTYTLSISFNEGVTISSLWRFVLSFKNETGATIYKEAFFGNNNTSFTWSDEYSFIQLQLAVAGNGGSVVDNVTAYCMLNAGETAYPYQPPFDLIWKDGYKVGHDNGYDVGTTDGYDTGYGYGKEDGYKEGYGDGISVSEYGVFYGANISGKIIGKYTNASQTSTSSEEIAFGIVNPTLVSGGFDFTYLRGNLQSSAPYGWMETEVTVIFKNIVPISMVDLMATGVASSLSSSFTFLDTNGKLHTAQWKQNAESGVWYSSFVDPSVTTENLAISRMTFRWSGGAAGLDVTISQDNIKYYTGYNQGYNEGLTLGTDQGYDTGYEKGEEIGYQSGYNNGRQSAIEEGIDGLGIFYGVVTIMRVMFQEVTKLLSAPIVGDLTVGLFVVGIPMTFVIIDLVIGLIRKFTGRSGND